MHEVEISSMTLEYIRVPVSARESGVVVDPTTDTVRMAFVPPGRQPIAADWKDAGWESDDERYFARILVGPTGAVALSKGVYSVWVEVTDNPEKPVREAGKVRVY